MVNGVVVGGQFIMMIEIENFFGFFKGIMGGEFMDWMCEQLECFGIVIVSEMVDKLDFLLRLFKYVIEWFLDEIYMVDVIIFVMGVLVCRFGLLGEDKYWQNGILVCVVCDGVVFIFRNKYLVVIGGGDFVVEEVMFLIKYVSYVIVLVRKDKLRVSMIMVKRLLGYFKVMVKFNIVGVEVKGDDKGLMSQLVVKDVVFGNEEMLEVNGFFYVIGYDFVIKIVKGQLEIDEEGYVIIKFGIMLISVEGVFVVGDVQDKRYRQVIISVGMLLFFFCFGQEISFVD